MENSVFIACYASWLLKVDFSERGGFPPEEAKLRFASSGGKPPRSEKSTFSSQDAKTLLKTSEIARI